MKLYFEIEVALFFFVFFHLIWEFALLYFKMSLNVQFF